LAAKSFDTRSLTIHNSPFSIHNSSLRSSAAANHSTVAACSLNSVQWERTAREVRRQSFALFEAMPDETLVYWSARASALAYWAAVIFMGMWLRGANCVAAIRWAWSIGCVLLVAHEILAMGISFGWSHAAAWEDVAVQTDAVFGVAFGGGLIVNYVAVVLWTADVARWWLWTSPYFTRVPWITIALWAFLGMMYFFGAVVFAEGIVRMIAGTMSLVAVLWIACSVACRRSGRAALD
jgi:hypothetical protein